MKKTMLLASGIFFALAPLKMQAQEEGVHVVHLTQSAAHLNDTLVIRLKGSDKILFIGDDLREMTGYRNADSLRLLFLHDLARAWNDHTLSRDAQVVHYFVHGSGKRRIKAENAEFSDNRVDLAYEVRRLDLDLPKYQYHIHDLATGYEFQVFVGNPDDLETLLNALNLNDAIRFAGMDKKELKRSYKIEMTAENNNYKITDKTHGRMDAIEVTPSFGISLIGNTPAAAIGADLMLSFSDKYSVGKYRTGIGLTAFPFVRMTAGEVSSVAFIHSYSLKFLRNVNAGTHEKAHWIGLQGGIMKSFDMLSYDKAITFGLVYEGSGTLNYSFDLIRDNNNVTYGVSLKMPF